MSTNPSIRGFKRKHPGSTLMWRDYNIATAIPYVLQADMMQPLPALSSANAGLTTIGTVAIAPPEVEVPAGGWTSIPDERLQVKRVEWRLFVKRAMTSFLTTDAGTEQWDVTTTVRIVIGMYTGSDHTVEVREHTGQEWASQDWAAGFNQDRPMWDFPDPEMSDQWLTLWDETIEWDTPHNIIIQRQTLTGDVGVPTLAFLSTNWAFVFTPGSTRKMIGGVNCDVPSRLIPSDILPPPETIPITGRLWMYATVLEKQDVNHTVSISGKIRVWFTCPKRDRKPNNQEVLLYSFQ